MGKLLKFLLLMASFLIAAQTVAAQTEAGLTMMAQAAYGGRFKFGEWLPIFVTVENNGPELTGEIRVRVTSRTGQLDFAVPAELPAGARKRFTIYTLPNNYSREIQVDLAQGEDVLLSRRVNISVLRNDRYVIGVVAADPAGLNLLSSVDLPGRANSPEVIAFPLVEIPDRAEGLRLLDALLFNDIDTGLLTPGQQTALKNWVAGGGRLIIGGGSSAGRTLAGLPARLQPVTLAGQREVPALPGLEQYSGEKIPFPGPFLLAQVQPAPEAVVLAAQPAHDQSLEIPLIVETAWGNGYVDFIALDLIQAPFDSWTGVIALARRLLAPGSAWSPNIPPDIAAHQMQDSQMSSALTNLPALDLPSIRVLSLLLAGYIVLVGPLNYLFLRWRDRLAWAWVTIPSLTLAFSGLAYGLSYQLRGNDIIVNQVSIIKMSEDGQATQSRTYVGLFSPNRQAYDIQVKGQPLIQPLGEGYYNPWQGDISTGNMSVVQGEPARLRGLTVNQWSIQSFVAETPLSEVPAITGQLRATANGLRGRLENHTDLTLKDVIVVFHTQFQKIGDIPPGQAADIQLDFNQAQPFGGGLSSYMLYQFDQSGRPTPEITFKQQILDGAVFSQPDTTLLSGAFFLAWTDNSPLEIILQGRQISSQKISLIYGRMPINFDQHPLVIPPGFSQADTLSTSGDAGICTHLAIQGYYIYQGTAEAKISLPAMARGLQPESLALHINTDGNWPILPTIELYDLDSREWVPLTEARLGHNPINPIERFYDPAEASVQLRLSQENPGVGGGCLYFDLTFAEADQ